MRVTRVTRVTRRSKTVGVRRTVQPSDRLQPFATDIGQWLLLYKK